MSTKFYDPKQKPFSIHGLYEPSSEDKFRRMPDSVAAAVNPAVRSENTNTAGGRIRFATDSSKVIVRYNTFEIYRDAHMCPATSAGVDLYIDKECEHIFAGMSKHPAVVNDGTVEVGFGLPQGMTEVTINLPHYGGVTEFEIGLDDGATVKEHKPYRIQKPVLFYGSSITQGACASRPGTNYINIISRELDCDFINLGFSGNARAELPIVEYMSTLDISAFVSDYDYNANNVDQLKETHYRMYEIIRKKHPDLPYIMVSKPDFKFGGSDDSQRRAVIMESYVKAINAGDKNVYFVDGAAFFAGKMRNECVIDNTHPTDMGFERMANNIGDTLKYVLYK